LVQCPACRQETAANNKFCGECGARLSIACPACGHPNPAGQKFCGECGTALAAAKAKATEVPGPTDIPPPAVTAAPAPSVTSQPLDLREAGPSTYTPKHLTEKILASRSALQGERKSVTVMFVDVCGFTTISEKLDPEDVHGIMDRAFEVML